MRSPGADGVIDPLVQASFAVMACLNEAAADHDLSLTQLRVLAILRDRMPKMAELAAFLGLDRSSVSGLIDRAVGRGLVRRGTSGDDGRVVRVGLTEKARELETELTGQIDELIAPLVGRLTASEQRRLGSLLLKMLA